MKKKDNNQLIPKVIHYFWFGNGKKPDIFYRCLESWKKNCPDYKIIEWNESNFDVNMNPYVRDAYKNNKYAFVSDYARFYIIKKYGGIYLDIDVEIIKPIDELLSNDSFMGFEDRNQVNPGLIMGGKKNAKILQEILNIYDGYDCFPMDNHNVCKIVTNFLVENKKLDVYSDSVQLLDGVTIYPFEYFCACDYFTKKFTITDETFSIHHYYGSWLSRKDKFINNIKKYIYIIIGKKKYDYLKRKLRNK